MLKKLLAALALFAAGAAFAAVEVNTAGAADLDSMKGIGPSTSKTIVKERKKGEFKDWEDFISRVKGVGSKTATQFSTNGLTVNGKPYAGASAAPAKDAAPAKAATSAAPTPAPAPKKP